MQEKMKLGVLLGLIGNVCFLLFAGITYIYYVLYYKAPDAAIKTLELLAYGFEISGFFILILSDYFMASTMRRRKFMKIAFFVYVLIEAALMTLELNSFSVAKYYDPYSHKLAMIHSFVSAIICFSFISLQKENKKFEMVIIICTGIVMGGMFGSGLGVRMYFSILVNAVAFAILFGAVLYMLKKELLEIDCYGEKNQEEQYKTVFFDK